MPSLARFEVTETSKCAQMELSDTTLGIPANPWELGSLRKDSSSGREAPAARHSTMAPAFRMPRGLSIMSDVKVASHGSASFTTVGAEDNIYISSLESHVSLQIKQPELQTQIQNKP